MNTDGEYAAGYANRWADLSNRKVSMFKKLAQKWEVAFLAKGGRLSEHEKLIVKDFAQWLEFEAAQQSVEPTSGTSGEAIPGVVDEIEELWAEE